MSEPGYEFTYHGHHFRREGIKVEKVSSWIAFIYYEKQRYTIPLSEVSPIFRSFLEQARNQIN